MISVIWLLVVPPMLLCAYQIGVVVEIGRWSRWLDERERRRRP